MSVTHYWHLQRLDTTGQCRCQQLSAAQTWLQNQYPELTATVDSDPRPWQTTLVTKWQRSQAALALLCLRCWVSHAIRLACLQLVSQFGDYYQFQGIDLFPFVLDDDGKSVDFYHPQNRLDSNPIPVEPYVPHGVQVVQTFVPGKASLESWAMHLTRNHSELNQFLLERGLYRVSDWAILNDTTASQLPRILGEFHILTQAEVTAAQTLLERYHQVYRRDRLQLRRQGKGGKCQVPTEPQLREINPAANPQTVLGQLKQLAYWLRQYRIQARGGTPLAESWETLESQDISAPERNDDEDTTTDFLQTYRQQLEASLQDAITETLTAYCDKLRRKKVHQDQAFLQALALFHCEGMGMKAIAPQVGLSTQVQVTRLMNLKQFRADVRVALLSHLQNRVRNAVVQVTSADRLQQIADRLDAFLAEDVDRLIAEAESEAMMPQNRTANSRFARQLCTSLQSLQSPIPPMLGST